MSIDPTRADALFREWACMDENAVEFLKLIARVARLADDIVDGDAKAPAHDMARLLYDVFVTLHRNPFFLAHHARLTPILANVILTWEASEEWKQSDNLKTRQFAFVLREASEQIATAVAEITGGFEHARTVIRQAHQVCCAEDPETFEQWDNE